MSHKFLEKLCQLTLLCANVKMKEIKLCAAVSLSDEADLY